MGIVDFNQETQYDVIAIITTLQQLLEEAQNDNHKLRKRLFDQQHHYQQDLDSKVDGILQENNILYNKQEKLETHLYTKGQALDTEKKESQYWKRLYDDLDKSLYLERKEFEKDRHLWIHREAQLTDHIRLLKQQQHSLVNHEASRQISHFMDQVSSMNQLNQYLMKENEGYRILLREKTIISGAIGKLFGGEHSNGIDYNKNQQRSSHDTDTNVSMNDMPKERRGLNLADELVLASSAEKTSKENDLLTEIKTLQDENRALQLYMNKILLRIIESKHSQNLLSIDQPKNQRQTTVITKPISPPISSYTTTISASSSRLSTCYSFDSAATTLNDTAISDTTKRDDGNSWSYIFKRMCS